MTSADFEPVDEYEPEGDTTEDANPVDQAEQQIEVELGEDEL